jgi:2',3'-cyclic-nucleotide 2'-phosphodiesterase (5'-nucleotidase family)
MRRILTLAITLCLVTAGFAPAAAATPTADSAQGAAASAALETGTTVAQTSGDGNNTTQLTILSYNDVQTAAGGGGDGNFSRLVTGINERRQASDGPVFVAGAGDQVSPNALAVLEQWRPAVEVLNVIDPDADVIGNHELDFYDEDRPFATVENFSNASTYPWLLANVVRKDDATATAPGTQNYTVVEKDGVRVGFVGLADEGAMNGKTDDAVERGGYDVLDPATVGERVATTLEEEENVDVVVALTHTGVPDSKDIANQTDSIDVILTGDDEVRYEPQMTDGVVISEAKGEARLLGELNLTVENGTVTSFDGRLIETNRYDRNETAANIVDGYRDEYKFDTVIGQSEVALDARTSPNYQGPTTVGNVGTDGFRYVSGADVALTNSGGVRSDTVYPAGNVTGGIFRAVYSFPNTVVTTEMSGAELKETIRSQTTTPDNSFGAQVSLQMSGVTFEWDPQERTFQDFHVNGEPLDEDGTYTVAVNSFMAGQEDYDLHDDGEFNDTGVLYGTAPIRYVNDTSPITFEEASPIYQGRLRRVDTEVATQSIAPRGDNVTVTVERPETAVTVTDDVWLRNETASRVNATDVSVSGDTITATFPADEYETLQSGETELDLYGEYNDSENDYQNYEFSVLNAEMGDETFGSVASRDLDLDGTFEDVNGNGEMDYEDVVLLFENSDRADFENTDAFDFNNNGRLDFNDIVRLFEMQGQAQTTSGTA